LIFHGGSSISKKSDLSNQLKLTCIIHKFKTYSIGIRRESLIALEQPIIKIISLKVNRNLIFLIHTKFKQPITRLQGAQS